MPGSKTRELVLRNSAFLCCAFLSGLVVLAALYKRPGSILAERIDHDEHQFVAAAALLAREGALPWLDYFYFHVPYLIVPYALVFLLTDHLLLGARLVSASCAVASVALVALFAARSFSGFAPATRYAAVVGGAILLVGNPLFAFTSGLAWNHDASLLLGVAAALVFLWAAGSGKRRGMLLSGFLLGLAAGTRSTFGPLVGIFLGGAFLMARGDSKSAGLRSACWLGAGFTAALLPLLSLVALAPEDFLFGNTSFQLAHSEWRAATAYTRAMSLPGKGVFLLEKAASPGTLVVLLLLVFGLVRLGREKGDPWARAEVLFLVVLGAAAGMVALLPTPTFPQYYLPPLVFLLLAALRATAGSIAGSGRAEGAAASRVLAWVFAGAVAIGTLSGARSYLLVLREGPPKPAVTTQVHQIGRAIRKEIGSGRVLTLAPIPVLEGGLGIYPSLATGALGWRMAERLTPEERRRFGIAAPADLERILHARPPDAILLGAEDRALEEPLAIYARREGFRALDLEAGLTLWVAPE